MTTLRIYLNMKENLKKIYEMDCSFGYYLLEINFPFKNLFKCYFKIGLLIHVHLKMKQIIQNAYKTLQINGFDNLVICGCVWVATYKRAHTTCARAHTHTYTYKHKDYARAHTYTSYLRISFIYTYTDTQTNTHIQNKI